MEVYHASTCIIEKPDTLHSRQFLDFGSGFYITTMYDQAEKYAARFVRRGKQALSILMLCWTTFQHGT